MYALTRPLCQRDLRHFARGDYGATRVGEERDVAIGGPGVVSVGCCCRLPTSSTRSEFRGMAPASAGEPRARRCAAETVGCPVGERLGPTLALPEGRAGEPRFQRAR